MRSRREDDGEDGAPNAVIVKSSWAVELARDY